MRVALRKLPLGSTRYGRRGYGGYRFAGMGSLGQDATDYQDLGPAIDASSSGIDLSTFTAAPGSIDTSSEILPTTLYNPTYTDSNGIPWIFDTNTNSWVQEPNTVASAQAAGNPSVPGIQSTAQALTSLTTRPTPVTSPFGATAGGGTSVASALNWFSQASMIPGVPNGVLILGGALAIAALGAFAHR